MTWAPPAARSYDPKRPLYVQRPVKVGEKRYQRGDLFPADAIAEVGDDVVRMMHRVVQLDHAMEVAAPPPPRKEKPHHQKR